MSYINNFKYNESLHLINYINSLLMLPVVIISFITAVIVMPYTRYSTFPGLCSVI